VIEIIGAPFDLCGMRSGSRLGPDALRLAGLKEALEPLCGQVIDAGNIRPPECNVQGGEGLRNFEPLLGTIRILRAEVERVLAAGRIPLVVGGEHTLVVGGISAALEKHGRSLGLLWIDAHADVNTPGTSSTGNIHGMPLASLAGLPSQAEGEVDSQWRSLLQALSSDVWLPLENVVWYGLRDVDPGEKPRLNGAAITMHDIDRYGVEGCWNRCRQWLASQGVQHLWVSFDVDALDPILAPGTGTAVRGGLSYREAHLLAELIREELDREECPFTLTGVDVVETNPMIDTANQTAIVAVEWLASLFGKTIL
jgi:arginase